MKRLLSLFLGAVMLVSVVSFEFFGNKVLAFNGDSAESLTEEWYGGLNQILIKDGVDQSIVNDDVKGLLSDYLKLRELSFNDPEGKADFGIFAEADAAKTLFEERNSDVDKHEIRTNSIICNAEITLEIRNASYKNGEYLLSVYEWTFYDYFDKAGEMKMTDASGYGNEHEMILGKKDEKLVILSDKYNDETLKMQDFTYNVVPDESDIEALKNVQVIDGVEVGDVEIESNGDFVSGYNIFNACVYSNTWALGRNPDWYDFSSLGGDCANFTSQCLLAGGMPMHYGSAYSSTCWYYNTSSDRSGSWTGAKESWYYWATYRGYGIVNPNNSQVWVGCPVYVDWHSDGVIDHAYFCVGRNSAGTAIINSHSSNKYQINWNYGYSDSTYYTVQVTPQEGVAASAIPDNTFMGQAPLDLGENFVAYIRNTVTGKYFTNFFDNVVLADGNFGGSQQWHFYRQADGSYCIVNDEANKFMDVAGGVYADGTNIQVYPGNGLDPQKFYIYFLNGNFYFRCYASTKVIDANLETNNVQLYGDDPGADMVSWARAFEILKINLDYGNWYYNFGTGSTVYVRNVASGKLMTANGYDVNFNNATYGADQKWRLHRRADGSYVFISDYAEGRVLDVSNGELALGTTVNLWNDTNFRAQGFYILPSDTEDYYVIKPCYASNVLDMDATTGDLHIYPPNFWDSVARNAQTFEIVFENISWNWIPPTNLGNEFDAYITNQGSGNTLTDMGDGSISATATVYSDNQRFHFTYDPWSNSYEIMGISGQVICPLFGLYGDGAPLLMADKDNKLFQRFRIYADGDTGYYWISPAHTNRLMDVDANTNSTVQLYGAGTDIAQRKFRISIFNNTLDGHAPVNIGDDFVAYIMQSATGKYVTNVSENVVVNDGVFDGSQKWHFHRNSDGSYSISNDETGKYFDVPYANFADRTRIWLHDGNNSSAQKFFVYFINGNYYFRCYPVSKMLDIDAPTGDLQVFGSSSGTTELEITARSFLIIPESELNPKEESLVLKDDSPYIRDGSDLFKVIEAQTSKDVLANFKNVLANVYDINGNLVSDNATVGTGYTVKLIVDGVEYDSVTIIIKGDIDGDGIVDGTDYLRIKMAFLGKFNLDEIAEKAADIDESGAIDTTDYIRIKQHFLGTYDIFSIFSSSSLNDVKVVLGSASISQPKTENITTVDGASTLGNSGITINYNSKFYGHDSAIDRDFGVYGERFITASLNNYPLNGETFINEFTGDYHNDVVTYVGGVLYIYPSAIDTKKTYEYNNKTITSIYGDASSSYNFGAPFSFSIGIDNAVLRGTGDFDGNGYNDFLFVTDKRAVILGLSSSNGIRLTEIGKFDKKASMLHCGDVDGNGYCDLIVIENNTVISILNNNLYFTVGKTVTLPFVDVYVQVSVGDINNDGRADVVTMEDKRIYTLYRSFFGRGDGFFGPRTNVASEGELNKNLYSEFISDILNPNAFSIGDMNGDGIDDLIPHLKNGENHLLLNHGESAYDYSLFGFVADDGTYKLYAGGRWCDRSQATQNSIHGERMGDGDHVMLATSKDGIKWDRYIDKPMFYLGSEMGLEGWDTVGENWWTGNTLEPEVVFVDGVYHMIIQSSGITQSGYYGDYLGYASSTDGINFERKIDSPVILPARGKNFTQFKEVYGCEIGFNHHELVYVADDPDGKPFHLYTGHFVNNTFSGYVRIRSSTPTCFYWDEREATAGFAQIGNQLGYISDYNGKGDRLYLRITFCDYEDADGKRTVPTLQYSTDGLNFSMSSIRLASVDVSDPITEKNRNVYFLGFCTLNGTGEIPKNENGNYELLYFATTANDPGSNIAIFYSEAGVGSMEFTIG